MKNPNPMRAVAVVLALSCAGAALAQGSAERPRNWYAGASVGRGGFDTDFERTKATIRSTGATSFVVTPDATTDTVWKGYFGYRFSPNVSIEAGYWNFGTLTYSANISAPVAASMQRTFRAEGYGADAAFWLPVYGSLEAFAKLGAMQVHTRASAADPGAGLGSLPAQSSRKLNSHWGLGLEYRLSRDLAARLEYETVRKIGDDAKFGTADVMMWSLGANYKF